jgi:uncharacterized protein YdhG (YjbR/CyaY superfamily)
MTEPIETVDGYIASFPPDVQDVLQRVRRSLHEAVPGSGEMISYHMPTITFEGSYLVAFAAWKKHIGLYPAPEGDPDFDAEMEPYRAERATARFPLDRPIPYDLIGRAGALLAAQRRTP